MPRMWQYRPYLKLNLSVKSPPNAQNCVGDLTGMRVIYRKSEISNLLRLAPCLVLFWTRYQFVSNVNS